MPNYSFECSGCGDKMEEIVTKHMETGDVLRKCERCGGEYKKQFGSGNVSFRGLPTPKSGSMFAKAKDKGDGRAPLKHYV